LYVDVRGRLSFEILSTYRRRRRLFARFGRVLSLSLSLKAWSNNRQDPSLYYYYSGWTKETRRKCVLLEKETKEPEVYCWQVGRGRGFG
jgi:hypothetical protein